VKTGGAVTALVNTSPVHSKQEEQKMKQHKFWIVIILIALVVAGCAGPTPTPAPAKPTDTSLPPEPPPTQAPQDESWLKVQQAGVLRVGTTADYPPFEYLNENLVLDGFDIALIQQIVQRLGLKVELNNFAFDDLPSAVAIDQVDVAIGALSVTPERQAVANFTNVYYTGSDAVLSRPEADPKKIRDTAALAATRLGVQVNSIYQTYAQQKLLDAGLMPKQNLFVYPDISQAVNELKAKRIDAVWMDLKPAQSFASAGGVKILVQDLNQQLYAIGMKKGYDTLRDKLNEALTQLQNDGTLANFSTVPGHQARRCGHAAAAANPNPAAHACQLSARITRMGQRSVLRRQGSYRRPCCPGEPLRRAGHPQHRYRTWKSGYVLAYLRQCRCGADGRAADPHQECETGRTFDFQVNLTPWSFPHYQGY
jgi:polar amino acid transport system substrate-binding protein